LKIADLAARSGFVPELVVPMPDRIIGPLGVPELLIIVFIVILIVCASRLPRSPFSNGPFSN
jgi:hypothetical protein